MKFRITIQGIVQGVGFRPFLYNFANKHQLKGTIRNGGNVGVIVELRDPDANFNVNIFMADLRRSIPPIALIEDITWEPLPENYPIDSHTLEIIPSTDDHGSSLTLPPDIAMCDNCVQEFNSPGKTRYFHYPFIACVQCGPRFTTMRSLPYDRQRSTMDVFPLCEGPDSCSQEYKNFMNRRFHAQTFGCHRCGPYYYIVHKNNQISAKDQGELIEEVASVLMNHGIAAIKGIGGIFLVCLATDPQAIELLRTQKTDRKFKPFAIMVPSIKEGQKYGIITPELSQIMTSFRRPIVLVPKRSNTLPESISPGLPHVGMILPYSGVHYLLFNAINNQPIVYTSGNWSNLPMAIQNEDIFTQLKDVADIFYLHNREIYQRCDDSVIRSVLDQPTLIRRSRGYVPEYFPLPFATRIHTMIAVGPELNSTGAIFRNNRIFPTQHIGNVRNLENYEFLGQSLQHLQTLLKINPIEIELIAHDLHPSFQSTKLAMDLQRSLNILIESSMNPVALEGVQHHHAHFASLMVDHAKKLEDQMVGIIIDGVGYGTDGHAWGGEILSGNYAKVDRSVYNQPIPMVGGDLCAKFPDRMALCTLLNPVSGHNHTWSFDEKKAIIDKLYSAPKIQEWFTHGETEFQFIIKQFTSQDSGMIQRFPNTSSFGRWLDAVAGLFDVCHLRTYQGEPAMRLEGYIWDGIPAKHVQLEDYSHNNIISTDQLLLHYADLLANDPQFQINTKARINLARSLVTDGAQLFANKSIELAKMLDISTVGVSGGVAYNEIIMHTIKNAVTRAGLQFLQHKSVPCGDAGISTGQIAVALAKNQ